MSKFDLNPKDFTDEELKCIDLDGLGYKTKTLKGLNSDQLHTISSLVTKLPVRFIKCDEFAYTNMLKMTQGPDVQFTKIEPQHNNFPALIAYTPINQKSKINTPVELVKDGDPEKDILISSSDLITDVKYLKHCHYGAIEHGSKFIFMGHVEQSNPRDPSDPTSFILYTFKIEIVKKNDYDVTLRVFNCYGLTVDEVIKMINTEAEYYKLAKL